MDIRDRLKEFRKDELVNFARQLNAIGYSGLEKESLIDHIIDNSNELDITAVLNRDSLLVADKSIKKIHWWNHHIITGLIVIIGLIGSIASIIALIQPSSTNININPDKVAEIIAKKTSGISSEKLRRLKEKIMELEAALKDERSGNTQKRKEALKALKKGNATKAQDLFKQRIEKDKENLAENFFNLGNAYFVDLKMEEALEAFNESIEIKPYYHQAWNNKGVSLLILARHGEALEAFNKAIEIKPDDHKAWNNRGYALDEIGSLDEALEAYDKSIEIKPDFYEAWYNKGLLLITLGFYYVALEAFEKAIEIKPDSHKAWYNKGLLLADSDRHDEALEACNKAIELKPHFHEAWYKKGDALYYLGRYKEALEAYKTVIEIKPHYKKAWYSLACLYSLKKEKSKALQYFQQAIKKGYNNLAHIRKDKDLDFIRNEKEFQEVISKLRSE